MTMSKLGSILLIICLMVGCYLVLTLVMPVITDLASSANATIAEITDPTDYPGAQEGVLAAPLIMYFVPAVVGVVAIILILRSEK